MNCANSVAAIVIACQEHFSFGLTQIVLEPFEQGTKFLYRVFVFLRKLKEHSSVVYLRLKMFLAINFLLDTAPVLQKLLRCFLVIPKIGCRSLRLNSA